jgi:hypothetical protein
MDNNKASMDNKAYLDQIAVKGKVKSGPIFTPMLIKLIAAGVVMLITMIVVGSVISSSNAKVTQSHERVYLRISKLGDKSNNAPLAKYSKLLRNSDLRAYASTLHSTLETTNNKLSGVIGTTGVKTSGISAEVTKAENANISAYTSALENAILSGTLDRVFATETLYQISTLIQYENESLKKANSQSYANLIKQSIQDLTTLEENFNTWSETH